VAFYWGDTQPPGLEVCGGVDFLDTCAIDLYIECTTFSRITFTLCQNHYDVYACIPSQVTIFDSDETNPSTRVYVVRCAWAPAAASYLVR
jgi:hypothetical protein